MVHGLSNSDNIISARVTKVWKGLLFTSIIPSLREQLKVELRNLEAVVPL